MSTPPNPSSSDQDSLRLALALSARGDAALRPRAAPNNLVPTLDRSSSGGSVTYHGSRDNPPPAKPEVRKLAPGGASAGALAKRHGMPPPGATVLMHYFEEGDYLVNVVRATQVGAKVRKAPGERGPDFLEVVE